MRVAVDDARRAVHATKLSRQGRVAIFQLFEGVDIDHRLPLQGGKSVLDLRMHGEPIGQSVAGEVAKR